jgi:tetratricopeptide (TPR) repeat protein
MVAMNKVRRLTMVPCRRGIVRTGVLLSCLALLTAGLLVSGCAVQPVSLPPRESGVQRATLSLLDEAEQALHAGNALRAEEYLERAIRIEPRNPRVWHALARSKFQQGQYPQAIQMARKSNSCLPDRATERSNWLLMEQAHQAMGDYQKAKNAHDRAFD